MIIHPQSTPSPRMAANPRRTIFYGLPRTPRFAAADDTRQRRWQLYTDLRDKQVPQEDTDNLGKENPYLEKRRNIQSYKRETESEEMYSAERVKAILENATAFALPEGVHPDFKKRPLLPPPYTLPTLDEIQQMTPDTPCRFTIPPAGDPSVMKIRPCKISPYLDLSSKSPAAKMLAAGNQPSEIAEEYQANWSKEKVCRDILQNFSDSHGHTLEGVSFSIDRLPNAEGLYRVRIDGKAQYDYLKAYVLGASDKDGQDEDAGGYGEGLKIIALNMLRDYGARYVKMASADWAMTYTLNRENNLNTLYNELVHLKHPKNQLSGNSLEFVTDRPEVVDAMMRATNYFYHPYNPDFAEATYENKEGGFRLLPANQNGNVYAAMQRYEYKTKGMWDESFPGLHLWRRKKLKLDHSDRDRTHLSQDNLSALMGDTLKAMTAEDILHVLHAMRPYWELPDNSANPPQVLLKALINEFRYRLKGKTDFPKNLVANDLDTVAKEMHCSRDRAEKLLAAKGYTLCNQWFRFIGMQHATDVLGSVAPDLLTKIKIEKKSSNDLFSSKIISNTFHQFQGFLQTCFLTPQQKVRFHLLQQGVQLMGKATQDFLLQMATLQLGWTQRFCAPGYTVRQEDLDNRSFEDMVMSVTSLVHSQRFKHESAEYSYNTTAMTFGLAQALLANPALQARYADLKAVWDLSFHPGIEAAFTKVQPSADAVSEAAEA